MKHHHAELMALYAQDAMETDKPWERWEARFPVESKWGGLIGNPAWQVGIEYRRKPRTISINGFEVPEPERTAPPVGTTYFIPGVHGAPNPHTASYAWGGDDLDLRYLRNGWVHLTAEAAEIHYNALISFTRK